jgi:hypothetical protein
MTTEQMKATGAAVWVLSIAFLGYTAGMTSVINWGALAVLACAPPLVISHFWKVPAQSMSESIRDVLR